ncbi:unnamed protein product, partial [Meganyctiphanes norvegica]
EIHFFVVVWSFDSLSVIFTMFAFRSSIINDSTWLLKELSSPVMFSLIILTSVFSFCVVMWPFTRSVDILAMTELSSSNINDSTWLLKSLSSSVMFSLILRTSVFSFCVVM